MAKVTLTEEKLYSIISESIYRNLSEAQEEGKVGQWLGNAYQWGRNKLANLGKDFEAGRLHQRAKNVDYDPLTKYREKYGDEYVKKMLAQRGDNYAKNRYQKMSDVWNGNTLKDAPRAIPTENPNGQGSGQQAAQQAANVPTAATQKRGFQPKAARPIAAIQQQVTNGQLVSKADGQLISAALGEYKQNHPEVNESVKLNESQLRNIITESIRKMMKK